MRSDVRRAPSTAARRSRVALAGRDRRPLPAGMWLEVERPELVHADHHRRIALPAWLAIGDGVELEHPVLLGLEVRVVAHLPGLQALKGDALLAEQRAQALVADVVDHPLGDEELGQLGQAPRRERQVVVHRPRQGELLDLLALGQRELRRPSTGVLRVPTSRTRRR